MHLRTSLGGLSIACGLILAGAAGAAVIYKWTDAQGVTHYSDQSVPGAEKIVTASGSSNGIGGSVRAQPTAAAPNKPAPGRLEYTAFQIDSPAREQVFFGSEIIPVRIRLDPGLRPGQSITWSLNGSPLQDQGPDTTSFTLQSLPRGTYQISVAITDLDTGDAKSAQSVTFYVRQPSELSAHHKKP